MNGTGRLKVVRVIARLNIGGPARHAVILSRGLSSQGWQTLLVHGSLAPGEGGLEDLAAGKGFEVASVPEMGRRISPMDDVRAFRKVVQLVFRERPDVVHTHTAKAGTIGRLAALAYNATRRRASRCLVVHTFHGHVLDGYFGVAGSLAARLAERALACVTDRIVTISPRQKADLVERHRVAPASKVAVIPLGLELDELLAASGPTPDIRAGFGLSGDNVVFGFVGRLVPIKDVRTLVRAFAIVSATMPATRLMVVGDGEERASLEDLARSTGLGGSVLFAGWRRDLAAVYGCLDAVVLSSLNEGTPVAIIEAMAAGKPVIATGVGGVADVVTDGETGLLVPPGDPRRLAEAMTRLALDPEVRRRMGEAGRRAVGRYRPERLVADVREMYERGLTAKRRRAVGAGELAVLAGDSRTGGTR